MQNIRSYFLKTCCLNFKNVKFDSNSNKKVTCLESYILISKSIRNIKWNMLLKQRLGCGTFKVQVTRFMFSFLLDLMFWVIALWLRKIT
jgi:hypothetical protein